MLLNGLWNFSFENGSETQLPVPGCFDTDRAYRFLRGIGTYRTRVRCGGQAELHFGGIGLRATILWDGREIGSEVTAYTPFTIRFNAGTPGEHELAVICDNRIEESPESEFRLFYDFYGFGGIYRDVTLRELPESYVAYARILPVDAASGKVSLHLELGGKPAEVTGTFDGKEKFVLPEAGDYELTVPAPKLWSPAHPDMHHLSLRCGEDVYETRFGLRTIEAKSGKLYLNGEELHIAGVNRHDVWPDTGAAVPPEVLRKDLEAIKAAGLNFIRGAHYPQSETMLKLADELGLLVWEETLGWENPVESLENPEFLRRQCSAARRMIRASVNHPSVFLRGFLNEAITNDVRARPSVTELAKILREEDPSRPITFATMFGAADACLDLVDVISFNTYPCWYGGSNRFFDAEPVKETLDSLASFVRNKEELKDKPILISEIGGAAFIGDHSGRRWSEEYQADLILCALECIQTDPRFSGIVFWQFCNSPVDDNARIMNRPRGYNNKGLVDEYRRPKLAWKRLAETLGTK